MSFKYQMELVTMDNYREIFSGSTVDILDEIRSAVLDDTPIANFINLGSSEWLCVSTYHRSI